MAFQKVGKVLKKNTPFFVIKTKYIQQLIDFYIFYYNTYVTGDRLRKLGNSDEK